MITVGALDVDFDAVADFTSTQLGGLHPEVRGKPDIIAPGTRIADGHIFFGTPDHATSRVTSPGQPPLSDVNNYGTSFAAPHVTGTAALVLDYADDPGRSVTGRVRFSDRPPVAPSDTNHNVVKAVVLNPADKDKRDFRRDNGVDRDYREGTGAKTTRNWPPTGWSRAGDQLDVTMPLDDEQGTGGLDTLKTLYQYAAGEQDAGTRTMPAKVPVRGWDRDDVTGTDPRVYRIKQPLTEGTLTVTLAWDRMQEEREEGGGKGDGIVEAGDSYKDPDGDGLRNLDLKIFRNGLGPGDLVAQSKSTTDNVEHLHLPIDDFGPGTYLIEVVPHRGSSQEYGLAWFTEPDGGPEGQRTGAVSFSVDGGVLNPSRPAPNPAEGLQNVVPPSGPNGVYTLGTAPPTPPRDPLAPGGHGLATEGEIFVSGTGSFDADPDGTNLDRLSGALGNIPRVGPHAPPPVASPATGSGVFGLLPNDNVNALTYGKDGGEVLYFSVDPEAIGQPRTAVRFESMVSPPVAGPLPPLPANPGGGDPGNEAAGDIYASQEFLPFGSYRDLHVEFEEVAPLVAKPNDNLVLYDDGDLGLQAPAERGSAIAPPEDDVDALELSDPSHAIWGADFNTDGVLQPWEDPVWFSLDWWSPSVGLATTATTGRIELFTPSLDGLVSPDDLLVPSGNLKVYEFRRFENRRGGHGDLLLICIFHL